METRAIKHSTASPTESVCSSERQRYQGLDALRAVAASAVFLQHLQDHYPAAIESLCALAGPGAKPWLASMVHHAHVGVDLFFVLSGCSLGLSFARKPLVLATYAKARVFRILPAYYGALLFTLAVRHSIPRADSLGMLALNMSFVAGYLPHASIINATWSLTSEVLFYAAFPWLACRMLRDRFGVRPAWRPALAVAFLIMGAGLMLRAGLFILLSLTDNLRGFAFELTQRRFALCRIDQCVFGIWAARALGDQTLVWQSTLRARLLVATALVVALILTLRAEGYLFLTPYGTLPYACIAPILAALTWTLAPLVLRTGAWLGERSYGFFLLHEAMLGAALSLLQRLHPAWTMNDSVTGFLVCGLLAYVGAVASGALSFATVEAWGRRRASLPTTIPSPTE